MLQIINFIFDVYHQVRLHTFQGHTGQTSHYHIKHNHIAHAHSELSKSKENKDFTRPPAPSPQNDCTNFGKYSYQWRHNESQMCSEINDDDGQRYVHHLFNGHVDYIVVASIPTMSSSLSLIPQRSINTQFSIPGSQYPVLNTQFSPLTPHLATPPPSSLPPLFPRDGKGEAMRCINLPIITKLFQVRRNPNKSSSSPAPSPSPPHHHHHHAIIHYYHLEQQRHYHHLIITITITITMITTTITIAIITINSSSPSPPPPPSLSHQEGFGNRKFDSNTKVRCDLRRAWPDNGRAWPDNGRAWPDNGRAWPDNGR